MTIFHQINHTKVDKVKELIKDYPYDPLIDAALNGYHGNIFVDSIKHPTVCQFQVTFFHYFFGDANSKSAKEIVKNIPKWAIAVPSNKSWEDVILRNHPNQCKKSTRCSFTHEDINPLQLKDIIKQLPSHYTIKQIDTRLAEQLLQEPWSDLLVANFKSIEDFLEHGAGFCILDGDKIVSGASSFLRFNGGYEVEIDTHKDYRNQGLGTIVGAAFVQYALHHNMIPHWDAENDQSIKIAHRLGFTIEREYDVIEINHNTD